MRTFVRFLIAFAVLAVGVGFASHSLGIPFGHGDYWDKHGILFLIGLMAFPRLTLLFSSVVSGGLVWWLAWLFAPRILVAVLATYNYWFQNPALVVISWLVALGGESSEKYVAIKRRSAWQPEPESRKGFESAQWVEAETSDRKKKS